jgi:hypothetical protein
LHHTNNLVYLITSRYAYGLGPAVAGQAQESLAHDRSFTTELIGFFCVQSQSHRALQPALLTPQAAPGRGVFLASLSILGTRSCPFLTAAAGTFRWLIAQTQRTHISLSLSHAPRCAGL